MGAHGLWSSSSGHMALFVKVLHLPLVLGATMLVFLFNSGVNVFVMRALGESWDMALITGDMVFFRIGQERNKHLRRIACSMP